jgi:hypothetical protein
MVCCSTGTPGPNVLLLDAVRPVSRWMERDVLFDHLPMDLRHVEFLQCHGVRLCIPDHCFPDPGRCVSL